MLSGVWQTHEEFDELECFVSNPAFKRTQGDWLTTRGFHHVQGLGFLTARASFAQPQLPAARLGGGVDLLSHGDLHPAPGQDLGCGFFELIRLWWPTKPFLGSHFGW